MSGVIEKQYQEWLTKVYGRKGLTRDQKEEMRKAFYSGTFVALSLVAEYSVSDTEEVAVAKIDAISSEVSNQIIEWSKA